MNTCPCCSSVMLRHIRHHHVYWFCPHCWQAMPDFNIDRNARPQPVLPVFELASR